MRRPLVGAGAFLFVFYALNVASASNQTDHNDGLLSRRDKRQILQPCPSPCFQCSPGLTCQNTFRAFTCNNICCCPAPRTLTGACDGDDAVAACLNNLCGQGFSCTKNGYCCRCPVGKSIGVCVNGKCPAGYACNTNNYCCAVGMIGALGPCINGQCPAGYTCGEGNMCYATSGTTTGAGTPTINGVSANTINAFSAFSALSRAAALNKEPKQPGGLSSFQLASSSSDNFGSMPSMHSYITNADSYMPSSIESPYTQPTNYNSFGSSAPVNFLQQQAINHAFQSHMLNPFLFNQQQNGYGSNPYKKHKN